MKDHREFKTGATRDSDTGKLEYSNFIHPLNDYSFAKYMQTKQIIGGEYRKWDNWQKWIPFESLFESLVRHTEILKLLKKWYKVFEYKENWVVKLVVNPKEILLKAEEKTMENELNAIKFNSEAMKLQILTDNIVE